jgi:hypothetical protein
MGTCFSALPATKLLMRRIQSSMDMEDEIDLHKKGWIIQRIGWAVLLLTLVFAALGLFGDGILSQSQIANETTTINYQRFGRYQSPMAIKVNVNASGKFELKIPQAYLRNMELDKIVPQANNNRIVDDKMIFTFHATNLAEITIYLLPQTTGKVSTSLYVNNEVFNVTQFIYP